MDNLIWGGLLACQLYDNLRFPLPQPTDILQRPAQVV